MKKITDVDPVAVANEVRQAHPGRPVVRERSAEQTVGGHQRAATDAGADFGHKRRRCASVWQKDVEAAIAAVCLAKEDDRVDDYHELQSD